MPQFITFLLVIFSVIQSPSNYATYKDGAVTQFKTAKDNGTLALMAHNFLAGGYFGGLDEGDDIMLIYADHNQTYEVEKILRYDALTLFLYRLEDGVDYYSDAQLFEKIYHSHDGRLVLQTCYGGSSGRLFIIAYPKSDK